MAPLHPRAPGVLDEKVVLVTGGAGLLGRAFCEAIARAGGVVIIADVNQDAAEALNRSIASAGGRCSVQVLDITDRDAIDQVLGDTVRQWGRLDAVVNNAYPRNTSYGRHLEDVEYSDFCENMNLHLGGYFLVAQRCARYFKTCGGGHIVNMASIYGVIAPRFDVYDGTRMTMPVEYAAIKAGILHLTRYFARYYLKAGIRCNALSPGGILDGQPDSFVDRYSERAGATGMLQPGDLTGTLVFLLSDAARHMTGQNLIVDDGYTL